MWVKWVKRQYEKTPKGGKKKKKMENRKSFSLAFKPVQGQNFVFIGLR